MIQTKLIDGGSNKMLATQQEALKRGINLIKAAGAKFHIKVGDLEYGEPIDKAVKRPIVNRGIAKFVDGKIAGMRHGEARHISSDIYPLDALQAVTASRMGLMYGNGNFITKQQPVENNVEVLLSEPKE